MRDGGPGPGPGGGSRWRATASRRSAAAVLTAALLLVGCGADTSDDLEPGVEDPPGTLPDEETGEGQDALGDEPADDATDGDGDGDAGEGEAMTDDELQTEVEAAVQDLADAEGVDPADVNVTAVERVTWADGALGCPQSDELYTQALVDGYRILLAIGDQEVAYHGQDGQPPFRCDDPDEPADVTG